MAKRSTASSRANTASPAKKQRSTAPTANARSTRAQSRELSEPLPTPRKRRHRADSVDDEPSQRSRRARTVARDVAPAEHLDAVEEEASQSEDGVEGDSDSDEIHARPSLNHTRESSVETSVSEEEARGLDPTAIPRTLELLNSAVIYLVTLLLPADEEDRTRNWNAIHRPDSREHKLLLREFKLFNLQKEDLTSQAFVRPSMLHRAILGQHYDGSRALPGLDAVVQRANLVKLVFDAILELDDERSADSLQAIEHTIQDVIGGDSVENDLANIGFVISTQALTAALGTAERTPPTEVFERYFPKEQGLSPSEAYLKRFVADWQNAENLPELQGVRNNIEHVHAIFEKLKGKRHQMITSLKKEYTMSDYVQVLIEFATDRAVQLDRIIESSGGIEGITEALEAIIANPEPPEESEQPSPEPSPVVEKPQQVATKSGISALRRRQRKLQSNAEHNEQQPAPTATMVAPLSTHKSSGRAGAPDTSIDPSLIQSHGEHPAEEHSGLMFNDDEVEVDEDEDRQDSPHYHDIIPTQDTGFQADRRDTSLADQRRQQKRAAEPGQQPQVQQIQEQAPKPRRKTVAVRTSRAPIEQDEESTSAQQQAAAADDPSELAGETQAPSSTSMRERLEQAKAAGARSRLLGKKGSRDRKTWSAAEEQRLNDLITLKSQVDKQLSYSDMVKQDANADLFPDGPVFNERKPEDLRFKARNMKVKIWRSGGTLPARWDQVALAIAQKNELLAYGKNYADLVRQEDRQLRLDAGEEVED